MKRRRWVWGIVGLTLLGGFWAWTLIESSTVRTDFRFLEGLPVVRRGGTLVLKTETYSLKGDPDSNWKRVAMELADRGFQTQLPERQTDQWIKGAVLVHIMYSQSTAAKAESERSSQSGNPRMVYDELYVTITRYWEETPWQKLLRRLGLRKASYLDP